MSLTASENFVKYSLFAFNFLFVITGIVLISVGATVQGVFHNYADFLSTQFFSVPSFLIAIGIIIFIIAFFGCCGAVRENYCMILTFAVLMVIVFILELAAGISGYVLRNDTESLIRTGLQDSMKSYIAQEKQTTYLWDHIQRGFECCGLESDEDWVKVNPDEGLIPVACCPEVPGTMGTFHCEFNTTAVFPVGCVSQFGDYIRAHAVSLGAAGVAICIIQFIGIFFACYLARSIKNKQGHSGF